MKITRLWFQVALNLQTETLYRCAYFHHFATALLLFSLYATIICNFAKYTILLTVISLGNPSTGNMQQRLQTVHCA